MRQVSKGNMITDTCNERTVVSFKAQEIEKSISPKSDSLSELCHN